MSPQTPLDWFSLTLRILIGALFLVTGIMKAFLGGGPAAFATATGSNDWNMGASDSDVTLTQDSPTSHDRTRGRLRAGKSSSAADTRLGRRAALLCPRRKP